MSDIEEEKNHSAGENGNTKTDASLKRKRSESEDAGQELEGGAPEENKKAKSEPASSGVKIIAETADSMIVEIPAERVGTVIGSKGMVIQELQARSGCKAVVNQEFPPGVPRQVNLSGTQAQMKNCVDLIKKVLDIGPTAIHINSMTGGPSITTVIEANQNAIGKIIGSGGNTIKEIQSKSGARVQIDQDYPPDVPRKVNITGTSTAVNLAVQMVQSIITTGHLNHSIGTPSVPAAPPAATPGYPSYAQPAPAPMMAPTSEVRQSMDVAKAVIGKIIGKGGETIHLIQKKSGCKVTVDQQVPEGYPCKVNMVGTAQTVAIAQHLVQEIMMGVPAAKIGANLPPQLPNSAYSGFAAAPAAAVPAAPAAAPYGMPQYQAMPFPQQPYAYTPQMQYPPYGMPQVYPPYGQPTAPVAAAPAAVGGYGAMPRAAGYSHANSAAAAQTRPQPAAASAPPNKYASSTVWTEHKTDDGIPYWYNASTGVSQVMRYSSFQFLLSYLSLQWERPKNM
jgi:far upstream element-binding protein